MITSPGFVGVVTILLLDLGFGFEEITWPPVYNIQYETIDVLDGSVQNYEAWYMDEDNLLRVDTGVVKRYYSRDNSSEENLIVSVVYPETARDFYTEINCYKSYIDSPPNVLPISDDFQYTDEEQIFNEKTVRVFEGPGLHEKIYVYKDGEYDIPVRYEKLTYDLTTGALESHTVTNFKQYNSKFEKKDVELQPEDYDSNECKWNFMTYVEFLNPDIDAHLNTAFNSYKKIHGKEYDETEHELRKSIFQKNWRKVLEQNRQNVGYKMELNSFADYTEQELKFMECLSGPLYELDVLSNLSDDLEVMAEGLDLPEELDLRLKGIVTPVKNQIPCGSCWAFSTTAVVEGAVALANGGRLLDLSEQSLIDCSWGYLNKGCRGGKLFPTFKYILENGIPTEQEYGLYQKEDGYCHLEGVKETFKIRGFSSVTPHSEIALKAALNKYGPVAVTMFASQNMLMYSNGIFYDTACNEEKFSSARYTATVVGYGSRDGSPYWIVKNTWGVNWGQGGYMLMSANKNNCFVLDEAYFAVA